MERSEIEARVSAAAALGFLALACGRPAEPQRPPLPPSAAEHCARGNERAAGGTDLPGAIEAFRKALAVDPGMAEAHAGLGLALLRSGDAQGAAAELESALSLAPPDAAWKQEAEDALAVAYLRRAQGERR